VPISSSRAGSWRSPRSEIRSTVDGSQYAQTFLEFPPMQKGASFNLEALKAELQKKMESLKSQHGD